MLAFGLSRRRNAIVTDRTNCGRAMAHEPGFILKTFMIHPYLPDRDRSALAYPGCVP